MTYSHEFRVYHAITGKFSRRVKLDSVSYSEPVYGKGGSLSANAPITIGQTADNLRGAIEPDVNALYVFRDGNLVWGGPIVSYSWRPYRRALSIGAVQWKQWLYDKFMTPDMTVNPVKDKKYSWTGIDQFQIARNLVTQAIADVGCPSIVMGTETSGIIRDLTTYGMNFQYLGDRIDSMATRDSGFEWDIEPRVKTDGDIELILALYYPERGSYEQGMSLRFKSTSRGGNIVLPDEFQVSSEAMRSRIWTSGAGTPPDQIAAYDEDPRLANDEILLRETVTNYQDVSDILLLADHARAERFYHGAPLSTLSVKASLTDPPVDRYKTGDRVRLIVKDDWVDIDHPAVRILDRSFSLNHPDKSDEVELLLNLNDYELPENTSEVE